MDDILTGSPFLPEPGPGGAFYSPFARQPMFMGSGPPMYTGPFNTAMGGSFGQMLQMAAPYALQALMPQGQQPFQIWQQQNLYDQIRANQFYLQRQQAAQISSLRDQNQMMATMNGFTRFMTGRNLTAAEMARNNRFAGTLNRWMPLLSNVLGPELIDELHGTRGSAGIMAMNLQEALRASIDPVTGQQGPTGATVGAVSQEIFERLYGQRADISAMFGVGAGQAGALANELQGRGLLGTPLGTLGFRDRLRLPGAEYRRLQGDIQRLRDQGHRVPLPMLEDLQRAESAFIDDGAVARAAETFVASEAAAGRTVTIDDARRRVRTTRDRLLTQPDGIGVAELERMPGGETLLQAADAARITDRLRNMAGAVKAMKDIFGDMGHPNAPMREIINGLNAMTQGGLATLTPGQLEMTVRRTHAIAQSTGIGIQGMMGLTTQAAGFADRFGVDRSIAVQAAQEAALFGRAAGDTQRLDLPRWGQQTMEQVTLTNNQLRMAGAASPAINQINAVLRMAASGMIPAAGNTELHAILRAVGRGESTYNGGQSLLLSPGRLMEILQRDAGVNPQVAQAILADRFGNQEFGMLANTQGLATALQQQERETFAGNAVGFGIGTTLGDALRRGAFGGSANAIISAVSSGMAADFFGMDAETVANTGRRQAGLEASLRNNLRTQIAARMPGAGAAEIDAEVERTVANMGGAAGVAGLATAAYSNINTRVRLDMPIYGSAQGLWQAGNTRTVAAAQRRARETHVTALMQSALSPLGAGSPVSRLVDAVAAAGPNTGLVDILSQAFGGINLQDIAARDPNGVAAAILGLENRNRRMDPGNADDYAKMVRNARVAHGLIRGGAAASEVIDELEARGEVIDPRNATPAERDLARRRAMRHRDTHRASGPATEAQLDEWAARHNLVRRLPGVEDGVMEQLYDAMFNGGAVSRLPRQAGPKMHGPGVAMRGLTQGVHDLIGMVMPDVAGAIGRISPGGAAAGRQLQVKITGTAKLTSDGSVLLDLLGPAQAAWNAVREAVGD